MKQKYHTEELPRTGEPNGIHRYFLSPEEIEARYGHIKPYTKRKELETTAPQTQPCRRRKA